MNTNESIAKAEAYQKKMGTLVEKQEALLNERVSIDKEIQEYSKRIKREEYRIRGAIAAEKDDAGKNKYSNETQREAEFFARSEKDEMYSEYSTTLESKQNELKKIDIANDILSKQKRGLEVQSDLQIGIMQLQAALLRI